MFFNKWAQKHTFVQLNGEKFFSVGNKCYVNADKKRFQFCWEEGQAALLDFIFEEIKHGDEDHIKWLKEKIEEIKGKINE